MWHKKCFNCAECHRPLDSVLACDGPDKEVHCRACYGKLFGPKGFGFGHAPTLVCADGTAPAVHDPRPNSGHKAAPGEGKITDKDYLYLIELKGRAYNNNINKVKYK